MKDRELREEVAKLKKALRELGVTSWCGEEGWKIDSLDDKVATLYMAQELLHENQKLILDHLGLEFRDQPSRRILKQKETKTEEK